MTALVREGRSGRRRDEELARLGSGGKSLVGKGKDKPRAPEAERTLLRLPGTSIGRSGRAQLTRALTVKDLGFSSPSRLSI